jgi:hypothetical protein
MSRDETMVHLPLNHMTQLLGQESFFDLLKVYLKFHIVTFVENRIPKMALYVYEFGNNDQQVTSVV